MTATPKPMTIEALLGQVGSAHAPIVVDVRREADFAADPVMVAGATRGSAEDWGPWAAKLPPVSDIVVYCVHGHAVSQTVAVALKTAGLKAHYLDGGLHAWRKQGGAIVAKPLATGRSSVWVTREHPKIDRIACPWLVRRFIDRRAAFLYVPPGEVIKTATACGATPYDVDGAVFGHAGELCSFDAFIGLFGIHDAALARLAQIVRGADTARLDLTPQSAGLLAMSHGLSALSGGNDDEMLEQGMIFYDALYAWCRGQHATAPLHA